MNYITTTELRTRSSELIDFLLAGEAVDLIHRSSIVGTIIPKDDGPENLTRKDLIRMAEVLNLLHLPATTPKQRANKYSLHLKKKYG